MKLAINFKTLAVVLFTAFAFSSCVKQEFDEVTTANVDPDITPTHTIRELQARATGPVGVEITEDIIVVGIIVADDSSGNIYKKIILQQDSSGIGISVDISDYYTDYKVGRRLFVKCKGLYIANNGGNFDLGNSATDPVGRIPAQLVPQYVVPGMWGQYLAPKVYSLSSTNIPTYTLVQFNNVEFVTPNVVWATETSYNLDITDCALNPSTLIVYSSAYSTFHLQPVPSGNGSIVGIYSLYNGDGELQVRDERDANMTNVRCNGGTGNLQFMQLDSIRMLDPGLTPTFLPADKKIRVTVISDYTTNFTNGRNCYVQDATAGIQLRFSANHSFAKGTVIDVEVSSRELSNYNGVLQINNIPIQQAVPVSVNPAIPLTTTIADINTNYTAWEGLLVKLDSVTITGPGIYSGINMINDAASNSIELYTSMFATFANDSVPTGTVSVTGILSEYNGTKEILIRNINDVQ